MRCEGCDDVLVDVVRQGQDVQWTNANGLELRFGQEEYDRVVASAREDFSWEDTKRTAERLVAEVFADVRVEGDYSFDWASARVREGIMTLSFSNSGSQKIFEFSWDGQSSQDAVKKGRNLLERLRRINA